MQSLVLYYVFCCYSQGCIVLQEDHSTYPDMAAYHSIAVTLGKAGYLPQLLHLIETLKEGSKRKNVKGSPRELNWDGHLEPDIVVFNAVSEILILLDSYCECVLSLIATRS